MKLFYAGVMKMPAYVTLCVRVWIEMSISVLNTVVAYVTLCVRVWIEILLSSRISSFSSVTLCVRVWIEISKNPKIKLARESHPLREGVD